MIKSLIVVFALFAVNFGAEHRALQAGEAAEQASAAPSGGSDQTARFTPVEGPDLKSRLAAAIKQARSRSKQTRFWTVHTFDVRPGVGVDILIIGSGGSRLDIGGVMHTTDRQYETRNVGVFLLHEADGGAITRAEIYNLDRPRDYSGYPVYWLGRATNDESLSFLKSLIDSTRLNEVAERATDAIGLHDDQRVEAMLKELIASSRVQNVRATAVSWLGHFPGQTPYLSAIVRNDRENVEVRKEAADALGDSIDDGALSALERLYGEVGNREVKAEILDSIADSRDEAAATRFLIKVSETDPDRELRREAIDGLGESQDPASLKALEKIISDSNTDSELQGEAVDAIGEKGHDVAAPLLMRIAKTHPNAEVRKEAIDHLGEIPGQLSFLVEVARNESENLDLRKEAIDAIGESPDADGMKTLQALFSAITHREVRREILDAISESSDREAALNFLIKVARSDSDAEVREEALSGLGEMNDDRAVEALADLYASERSEEVKEEILDALAESNTKRGLRKLIEVAKSDPSPKMRRKAIEALGESDDPEAAEFLERIIR
ncbi:MAG TPA: HEAT repeat domain-containing protein [Blastocatellia bacterium]|nr:HEAT repeat domain-containing protein [Blastocatellia bacterium]